ncbi:MAG: hypothetical protein ABI378_06385 [Chitinophagaceae bacterium]
MKSRNLGVLIYIVFAFIPYLVIGQNAVPTPFKKQQHDYLNGITFNFPTYVNCSGYYGYTVGFDYFRIIGKRRNFQAMLSASYLLSASAQETVVKQANSYRANISALTLTPGLSFYPLSKFEQRNVELGVQSILGRVSRRGDYLSSGVPGQYLDTLRHALVMIPQIHLGFSIHGHRHFLLNLYGDFGPIIVAAKTGVGYYADEGLKIGRSF